MILTPQASLSQLGELMGSTATEQEAQAMLRLLVEAGYEDTLDVPDDIWCQTLCRSVVVARAS